MINNIIEPILSEWTEEINEFLCHSNSLCLALFSEDKNLIFANPAMKSLFKGEPYKSFINPTFDKLISTKPVKSTVFEGLLTIGDYNSINCSIIAHVYLKKGNLLVVGGFDTEQLNDQNQSMHQLNNLINNLQRQLIKEKIILENTFVQINEKKSALQKLNAQKDKFFSIIAHDLKAPFNSITGFSELLVEQIKKKDYVAIEKYALIIYNSSRRAMDLLMNLMEWSRSQTGRMEFNPEPFDLKESLKEITALFIDIAGQKGIVIKSELPIKTTVFADKAMINTVLRNLISNAIKFTKPDGVILVEVTEEKNKLTVAVKDNGIGISKERVEKLFHIEESVSTTGTANEKGTGLGLILCKEFMEKHDGELRVESEEGIGSTFYFTIPCNSEQVKETIERQAEPAEKNESSRKLKILIAEDDEVSEMLIDTYIKMFGKEILKAGTGVEAVQACRNNPDIDLILMDIRMPDMGGHEATRQIRQFNKQVIIIAQTANAFTGDREKAIESGCNDYITKPINKTELLAMILKYFGK